MKQLLFLLLYLCLQQITFAQINKEQIIGLQIAPQSFQTLDNKTIEIGKAETNKFTLIDFYFTTCKPCNANIKKVEKLLHKYNATLDVISVDPLLSDTKEKISVHKDKYGITSPIVYGDEAIKVLTTFKLPTNGMGYPFYILINKENKVVFASLNSVGVFKKIENFLK